MNTVKKVHVPVLGIFLLSMFSGSLVATAQTSEFTVTNDAAKGGFVVRYSSAPATAVPLAITSDDLGAALPDPALLTITPDNFNQDFVVRVAPVIDADNRDENVVFTFATSTTQITKTVRINDTVSGGLLVSGESGITVDESGQLSESLTVVLEVMPSSSVEVVVSSDAAVTTSLLFDENNWNEPQTIELFDSLEAGDYSLDVSVATGSAPEYAGLSAQRTITVEGAATEEEETAPEETDQDSEVMAPIEPPLPEVEPVTPPEEEPPVFGGAGPVPELDDIDGNNGEEETPGTVFGGPGEEEVAIGAGLIRTGGAD